MSHARALRWTIIALVALCLADRLPAQPGDEAARVRILLVVDTDDEGGATWGRDGDNVRAVLEAALKKQQLEIRYTLEVFTGREVTPERMLAHCKALQTGPDESVLFYCSGHGGYNRGKGHFLALTHGTLYRKDLLATIQAQKPRLIVLLTDCCSNYAGGAWLGEPAAEVHPARGTGEVRPKAVRTEPVVLVREAKPDPKRRQKAERPNTKALLQATRAARDEPPGVIARPLKGEPGPAQPKARREEPAARVREGQALITAAGRIPLQDILERTDGEVLRHLLFRPRGIVDINGCQKGELSHGTLEWGGSIFTNAFLGLQRSKVAELDRNGNQVIEWNEFFPSWQQGTVAAGQRVSRGKLNQVPEANRLP